MPKNRLYSLIICILAGFGQVAVSISDGTVPSIVTPSERKLMVIVAHEEKDDTVEQTDIWADMRKDEFRNYCSTKGHRIQILDDDATDATGKRIIPEVDLSGKPLPLVLVYDRETKKLIDSEPLPAGSTSATVMDIIRRHGG